MEGPICCNFRCSDRAVGAVERRYAARAMGTPFRHRIRVRWNECDLQGVVFYANYLMYFDIAMTELWREAVEPFGDMNATGADMVVAEAHISYRASARFDDELDLVATVQSMGQTSMTTELSVERMPGGEVLAEGRLRHVFVEAETLKNRSIPEMVRAGLQRHQPA